jgi:NADPH:quinone reductase-like Zn-dependent oxidoreductase
MQLCLARGANVYVTSGSEEKIRKAISLGAKGGVNYKSRKYLSLRIWISQYLSNRGLALAAFGSSGETQWQASDD